MRFLKFLAPVCLIVTFLVLGKTAQAKTPTLSLVNYNNGGQVQLTTVGDAYANVYLFYKNRSGALLSQFLGKTDVAGSYVVIVVSQIYDIMPYSSVYVGINNQNSQQIAWPYVISGGSIALSEKELNLSINQTATVNIFGGITPYSIYNGDNNNFKSVLSGGAVSITGLSAGSASVNICSSDATCVFLPVSVTGTSIENINTNKQLSFESNLILMKGASANVPMSGSGNYVISSVGNKNIANLSIVNNKLIVFASQVGNTSANICQADGQCKIVNVAVKTFENNKIIKPVVQKPAPVKKFKFTKDLNTKSTGNEVKELQTRLKSEGFYKGVINGKFTVETTNAVRAYQKKKGLKQVGVVGPATRASLNK